MQNAAIMGFLRYEQALRKRPLRTKSMTSGLLTVAGSLVSEGFRTGQVGQQPLATFSHAVYGFCIGGTIPHLFYKLLESAPENTLLRLILERTILAPVMVGAYFLVTSVAQGDSLKTAVARLRRLFRSTLIQNWKFWTPAILFNLTYVPPRWRVVFASLVAFVWNVYLATQK